jgi:hypothetical protein
LLRLCVTIDTLRATPGWVSYFDEGGGPTHVQPTGDARLRLMLTVGRPDYRKGMCLKDETIPNPSSSDNPVVGCL